MQFYRNMNFSVNTFQYFYNFSNTLTKPLDLLKAVYVFRKKFHHRCLTGLIKSLQRLSLSIPAIRKAGSKSFYVTSQSPKN